MQHFLKRVPAICVHGSMDNTMADQSCDRHLNRGCQYISSEPGQNIENLFSIFGAPVMSSVARGVCNPAVRCKDRFLHEQCLIASKRVPAASWL